MEQTVDMSFMPAKTQQVFNRLAARKFISDFMLVYTKDIEDEDMASHLSPAEVISKDQMAAFFTGELIKIREEI